MIRIFLVLLLTSTFSCFAQTKKTGIDTIRGRTEMTYGRVKKGLKEGVWTSIDLQGNKVEETTYSKGLRNGMKVEYFYGGTKSQRTGQYKDDKKVGTWYQFNQNGDTIRIENYADDVLNGYYRISSGEQIESGFYKNGLPEGWKITWMMSEYLGSPIDSQYYTNGKRNGPHIMRAYGHVKELQHYSNDLQSGQEIICELYTGKIIAIRYYKEGKRDSIYTEFDVYGNKIRTGYYSEGHLSKQDSLWNSSGQLTLFCDFTMYPKIIYTRWSDEGTLISKEYADTQLKDSLLYFFPGGAVKERIVYSYPEPKPGRKQTMHDARSIVYSYYPNGTLQSKAEHNEYYRDGLSEQFDSSGILKARTYYRNGAQSGTSVVYFPSGATHITVAYEHGNATGKYLAYYANGKLKLTGVCRDGFVRDSVRVWTATGIEAKRGTALYDTLLNRHFREEKYPAYLAPQASLPQRVVPVSGTGDGVAIEIIPDKPLERADVPPQFPGGSDSLQAFLKRNLKYPALYREQSLEGTVYIQLIIEKDGSFSGAFVISSVAGAPAFSSEALRVVAAMPKWVPGKNDGDLVRMKYILPVQFSLQ